MPRRAAWALLLLSACASPERPISPWRLEGFPGAPVEEGLFPLVAGTTWEFRDRLDPTGRQLKLELAAEEGALVLRGREAGAAPLHVAFEGGYLTLSRDGEVVDRPLPLGGSVGDSWASGPRRATAFGYDRLEALGRPVRALVVAVDGTEGSARTRSLYWFAPGMGWVRIRTEREGRAIRDAQLTAFLPGPPQVDAPPGAR